MMKRIIAVILASILIFTNLCVAVYAKDDGVNVTFNAETGEMYINGSGAVTRDLVESCFNKNNDYGAYQEKQYELKSVVIEGNITEIAEGAFQTCKSIRSIVLPNTLKKIGASAFLGCHALSEMVFPEGLEEIEAKAFYHCGLMEVTIPGTVKYIGEFAFFDCNALRTATINEGVKEIDYSAFDECKSLKYISFPDSLEKVGYDAFSDTEWAWDTKDENPLYMGNVLARYSGTEDNLVIREGTTGIAYNAFYGNDYLKSVVIPQSVKSIQTNAFAHCDKLTSVTISDGVEEIGAYAFYSCNQLKEVEIPVSVSKIGKGAFYETEWFTKSASPLVINKILLEIKPDENGEVNIPKEAEYIADSIPRYNENVTSVKLHNGVKTIGEGAFQGCKNLKSIDIPRSVTKIGDYAFQLTGLEGDLVIPSSIEEMGKGAFSSSGISSVHIESQSAIAPEMFNQCENIEKISFGSDVTYIEEDMFSRCTALERLTLPEGIQKIGKSAFYHCTNLSSIILPQTLKEISQGAFSKTGITELAIPDSVECIGANIVNEAGASIDIYVGSGATDVHNQAFGGGYGDERSDITVHTPKNSSAYFAAANYGAKIVLTKETRIGEKYSELIETDIRTTINQMLINAYAIDGKMVILLRDLEYKGFDISFDEETRTATAAFNPQKQIGNGGVVVLNSNDVLYSDIRVYVNGIELDGYNVSGYMAVVAEDMGKYVPDIATSWYSTERELRILASEDISTVDYLIDKIGKIKGLEISEESQYFADAKSGYSDACVNAGYINEYDYNGLIYPDSGLSLYMFATIAGRAAYGTADEAQAKKNIQTESEEIINYTNMPIFIRSYITRLYRAGVINGEMTDGKLNFDTNRILTKSEVSEILGEIL